MMVHKILVFPLNCMRHIVLRWHFVCTEQCLIAVFDYCVQQRSFTSNFQHFCKDAKMVSLRFNFSGALVGSGSGIYWDS